MSGYQGHAARGADIHARTVGSALTKVAEAATQRPRKPKSQDVRPQGQHQQDIVGVAEALISQQRQRASQQEQTVVRTAEALASQGNRTTREERGQLPSVVNAMRRQGRQVDDPDAGQPVNQKQEARTDDRASKQDTSRSTTLQPDIVYRGESIDIQKTGNVGTVVNKSGKILFQYEIKEKGEIVVHQDKLSARQKETFLKASTSVSRSDFETLMKDKTGRSQAKLLGPLAPQGSHAIAIASRVTNRTTLEVKTENYTFQRSGQGDSYTVIRNDEARSVVAQSDVDGKIKAESQTLRESQAFQTKYMDARLRAQEHSSPELDR